MRIPFLNWKPDLEPFSYDGLVTAENVVHSVEGYKPVYLASDGSFSTTGALTSVNSVVAKPVGPQGDLLCAWVENDTLYVGMNGVTLTTGSTGFPASFATTGGNQAVSVFDVCELAGYAFFVVEAQQNQSSPATAARISYCGVAAIS